jgi:hypothetical protein
MIQQMMEKGCADALVLVGAEDKELIQIEDIGLSPEESGGFQDPVVPEQAHTAGGAEKTPTEVS